MKISEFKNEEAIDLLADIIEPMGKIFADRELANAVARKASKMDCIKIALKNNKSEVIEIIARMDGADPTDYKCGIVKILAKALEILNDEELSDFFSSQGQMMASKSSSPAMVNTKAEEQ